MASWSDDRRKPGRQKLEDAAVWFGIPIVLLIVWALVALTVGFGWGWWS